MCVLAVALIKPGEVFLFVLCGITISLKLFRPPGALYFPLSPAVIQNNIELTALELVNVG
jgi:hypothetical protein